MKKFQINIFILIILFFVNKSSANTCLSCKPEEIDCTIDPTKIKNTVPCNFPSQVCFVRMDNEGRNIRGCTEEEQCKNDCLPCANRNCNQDIYPFKRPVCYQCNGTECANPAENIKPERCLYHKNEQQHDCYRTKNEFYVKRGCVANVTQEDLKCPGYNKNCTLDYCSHFDQDKGKPCNFLPVELTYKCYGCNSNEISNCANEFTETIHEICKEYKGCYERFVDGVAYRGCASSLSPDELNQCKDPNNAKCRYCDSPVCNFEEINAANMIKYTSISFLLSILSLFKLI
ncbi:uncharacterized protein LOC129615934 [Condylostylus longicornis]|uniref:uncharacterized protein LOC129615934 n=1 Tax=Condylostylus longicornis TaxID=2530218 RepID=UPI00244DE12D|nr:uncharacterized protein LOC129615934 [Condylostylus longicornis]